MTKKSILVIAIAICIAEILLFLMIQIMVGDVSYFFENDKEMVHIVAGMDSTIYYLSPENHTIEVYKGYVNDYYDLFDHWRSMSGLPEEVVLNSININSGYEEMVEYSGSNILQYITVDPVIECDLSATIYSQLNFEELIETWAQTIQKMWEGRSVKLTITVEGGVVYMYTA